MHTQVINCHASGNNLNVRFQYNRLGERVGQTVNGMTTNYVLDQAAGLTQILGDRTNTYLYGAEQIAQYQADAGPDGVSLPRVKIFTLPDPLKGTFPIRIIGYESGGYTVQADTTTKDGETTDNQFTGTAWPDSIDTGNMYGRGIKSLYPFRSETMSSDL